MPIDNGHPITYPLSMSFHGKLTARVSAALFALCFLAPSASALTFEDVYEGVLPGGPDGLAGQAAVVPPPSASTPTTSAELTGFWEKLKNGVSDPLCKKAEIKLNKEVKIAGDVAGFGGGVRRGIKRYPDGKLALIDEIKLNLSLTLGGEAASLPDVGALNIGLSSRLEGKSQVVRPLESQRFCKEVLEWAKFYELKAVLPSSRKRIVKMEAGEIWKLPLTMSMSFSLGAGANIGQVVNISLSAAVSRESKPSVSLRRLDADHLRLRLRLDRLVVRSVGLTASTVELPLDALGLESAGALAADILGKTVPAAARKYLTAEVFDKLLLKEINKYLAVKLSFGHSRFSGKKLLLEFILNPDDPEQMASLEKFLRGDFGIVNRFLELGLKLDKFAEDDDALAGLGGLEEAAGQTGDALGAASGFAGTDIYNGHSSNAGLQVPVVGNQSVAWGSAYHRYQSLGNAGETIHVNQRSRTRSGSGLDIPFAGTLLKHNSQRDVYVLNKENTDGTVTRPVLLYQQYEGLVGRGSPATEGMLERANGVLRYVGVNGNGTDGGNQLPVDDLLSSSRRYSAGLMGFKLLISEKGVQEIIFAPAQAIMRSYMNMMRELHGEIIDKVMGLFTFDRKGAVAYDPAAAMNALGITPEDEFEQGCNPLEIMDTLASAATRVIRDIAGVRDAPDWKSQSEQLARVAGGASKSGLKYEDFLKVVVQLVKPGNVSASVYVHLDPKKKGAGDITRTHNFFDTRANSYDATLSGVTGLRERFADPAELSD